MRSLVLIFLVLVATAASAKKASAPKPARKVAQTDPSLLFFRVVYGEKTTDFVVRKAKAGATIEFRNSDGAATSRPLSETDYKFLKSKVAGLTGPSNSKEFCTRNYIEILSEKRNLVGCLGAGNKLARDMQATVNLLTVLF